MRLIDWINPVKRRVMESRPGLLLRKGLWVDIVVICAVSITVLTWFRGDYFLKFDDSFFVLNPSSDSSQLQFIWQRELGTGLPRSVTPDSITLLPIWYLASFFQGLGASPTAWQQAIYYGLAVITAGGAYFLTFSTVDYFTLRYRRFAALASAMFYTVNPYALSIVWGRQTHLIAYAIFPILLALFVIGLHSHHQLRIAIVFALLLSLFSFGTAGPFGLVFLFAAIPFFLFDILFNHVNRISVFLHHLRFSGILVTCTLAMNAWWIIAALVTPYGQQLQASTQIEPVKQTLEFVSQYSTIPNDLRLLGWHFIYARFEPEPFYTWTDSFGTPLFQILSFLPPAIVIGSLIVRRAKINWFYLTIVGLGLFLMKGTAWPLGNLNESLLATPAWALFRIPYDKFGILVSVGYAALIGVTLAEIARRLMLSENIINIGRFWKLPYIRSILRLVPVTMICIVLFGLLAWPFWTGDVIRTQGQFYPSGRIQVPDYYVTAGKWLNQQPGDFRIAQLPFAIGSINAYNWSQHYATFDPVLEYYLAERPLVSQNWGYSYADTYQASINYLVNLTNQTQAFTKYLALGNIQYVVLHKDWDTNFVGYVPSPESLSIFLKGQQGLTPSVHFQQLWLYNNTLNLPLLYSPNEIVYFPSPYNSTILSRTLELGNEPIGTAYIFSKSNSSIDVLATSVYQLRAISSGYPENITLTIDGGPPQKYTLAGNGTFGSILLTRGEHSVTYSAPSTVTPYLDLVSKPTELDYSRMTPSEYRVHVNGTGVIIFSESYADEWSLVSRNGTTGIRHFVANGFSNGWILNSTGDFSLKYSGQVAYQVGKIISLASAGFLLTILAVPFATNWLRPVMNHPQQKKAREKSGG